MKKYFIGLTILLSIRVLPSYADITVIKDLNYVDQRYNALYKSTIASKNRMLKSTRRAKYDPPVIYRYTLKKGEDIWTIIAKTSLNIDTIAALNRIDFIGMLTEGQDVYLSDTLGLFLGMYEYDRREIADKYSIDEKDVQILEDPMNPGESLYFAPEIQLSFLERTFLTGVVFHAPLMGIETSKFGPRADPFVNEMAFHGGVDISAEEGKTIHASRWGKVLYAESSNGYGNLVILQHELGYYTFYGHMKEITVEKEESIESGQTIGTVGTTGRTTGPHLHFEIRRYDKRLNPDNIPFFLDHK